MKILNIHVTEQQLAFIQREVQNTGLRQAEVFRRAIDTYRDYKELLPKLSKWIASNLIIAESEKEKDIEDHWILVKPAQGSSSSTSTLSS